MATLKQVLEEEKEQIDLSRLRRFDRVPGNDDLVGLALSGGGIRSATFNLGLLQSFATKRLLHGFDYLSTVSGGGYIGAWLMAWMRNAEKGIQEAETEFGISAYNPYSDNERPPVRFLRYYSRYLSPQFSVLSADLWTLAATYLRNTALNLVIFGSLLVLLLLLPRWIGAVCYWASQEKYIPNIHGFGGVPALALSCSLILALFAVWWIGKNLVNVPLRGDKPPKEFPRYAEQRWIQIACISSLIAACAFFSVGLHSGLQFNRVHGYADARILDLGIFVIRLLYLKLFLTGAALYALFILALEMSILLSGKTAEPRNGQARKLARRQLAYWALPASFLSGFLLIGVTIAMDYLRALPGGPLLVLGAGTFLLISALQMTAVFHVGLIGRALPDGMREWSARFGAWMMIYQLLWLSSFGFIVYVPEFISRITRTFPRGFWLGLLCWVAATAGGVIAGRGAVTNTERSAGIPNLRVLNRAVLLLLLVLARIAPYLFIGGILSLFAFGLAHLPTLSQKGTLIPVVNGSIRAMVALTVASMLAAGFFGWRVDVNQFSMHSLYRNRLVRCYLGASAKDRRPQPFTAFDPADDIGLAELAMDKAEGGPGWPYLIINATLNVVKGKDALGLQSRKAKSFIFSPLYCGFDRSKFAPVGEAGISRKTQAAGASGAAARMEPSPGAAKAPETYGQTNKGGIERLLSLRHIVLRLWKRYLVSKRSITAGRSIGSASPPEHDQHGGISLGTAMAISGAATSPNMGYNTTAVTAFLLSLFNVRLGWWIGNPGKPEIWRQGTPSFGLYWLVSELFGSMTDESEFLYLSDGGHFENLGIYELVRRQCMLIVASDATADPDYDFVALANAIERCRTDFAVNIEIRELESTYRDADPKPYAIGSIDYGNNRKGTLIYIKPTILKELPTDVQEYARLHQAGTNRFPHQSTMNQFFSELQFESYRMLGAHTGDRVAAEIRNRLRERLGNRLFRNEVA